MPTVADERPDACAMEVAPSSPRPVPRGQPRRRVSLKERAILGIASLFSDCCGPREQRALGILMYHRVANPVPGQPLPTWNVTPRSFEQQLSGLLARGWQAWPLKQVLACLERNLPIPRTTFVVTFDDGYVNNLIHAHPILTRLRIPATLFLATAYLDSDRPLPSDDWSVAGQPGVPSESWRPLTSEECRRLIGNGLVELGAHTHSHTDFRGRPAAFAADLRQNLAVLRERFGIERPVFAFPYGTKMDGFVSPELVSAAREVGVLCSLTAESRIVRHGDSPFDWGRFIAEEHDTARTLAARLGGWQDVVRRLGKAALRK
jgi:peptidoglycan/xylan/chitin deacetylase (PgdA/CDA1 family)